MSGDLFRIEAVSAQSDQLLGTIRLGNRRELATITIAAICAASSLVAYAVIGQISRKARLPGVLLPADGIVTVVSSQPGFLTELRVREGDRVRAGQVLAVLSTERNTATGGVAELVNMSILQRRQALEAEKLLTTRDAEGRRRSISERIQSFGREIREAEAEQDTARQRLQLAQRTLDRHLQLAKDGFVSQAQVQQRQEELLDAQGRLHITERTISSLARELESTRAGLQSSNSAEQTTLSQLDRNLAMLDQERSENEAKRQLMLITPSNATVGAIPVNIGQPMQPGQAVLTLIAESADGSPELQAHLYATSRAAGFLRPGQSVWLRYAAYPYQKFGMGRGDIISVSRSPVAAQDLPAGQANALIMAAQSSEPMYRVTVKVSSQEITAYGKKQKLKPGMAVDADVIQDRRAIWEWLLDPLLAAWKGTREGSS